MKRESEKEKNARLDLLVDKIKIGVQKSFEEFLEESIHNNDELVIMRNNKVVLVPASEIKLKK